MNTSRIEIGKLILYLALACALVSTYHQISSRHSKVHFYDVKLSAYDGTTQDIQIPYSASSYYQEISISGKFKLEGQIPLKWSIIPDDCLMELEINSTLQKDLKIPFCDTNLGETLNLVGLKTGENSFKAQIRDLPAPKGKGKVGFRMSPSHSDGIFAFSKLVLALASILFGYCLIKLLQFIKLNLNKWESLTALAILSGGIFSRLYYFSITGVEQRAHDHLSHLDYVNYILNNWSIPPASAGWELHQPPLYYFLSAIELKLSSFFGLIASSNLLVIKSSSLLISFLIFLGLVLFVLYEARDQKNKLINIISLSLPAFLPGILFTSTRLNNDVLSNFLALVFIITLLSFWRHKQTRHLYILSLISILFFWTKLSSVVYIFSGFIVLLWMLRKNELPVKHFFLAGLILIAGSSPLVALRLNEKDTERILKLGNLEPDKRLRIDNKISNFIKFNPQRIIKEAQNTTYDNTLSRKNFWEFLFKSAVVGEFKINEDARFFAKFALLGLLMITTTLPFACYGFYRYKTTDLLYPNLILLLVLPLSLLTYRILFPYACNQDFRFIAPIVFPATILISRLDSRNHLVIGFLVLGSSLLALATLGFLFSI